MLFDLDSGADAATKPNHLETMMLELAIITIV
jgi:hypothetical protein